MFCHHNSLNKNETQSLQLGMLKSGPYLDLIKEKIKINSEESNWKWIKMQGK